MKRKKNKEIEQDANHYLKDNLDLLDQDINWSETRIRPAVMGSENKWGKLDSDLPNLERVKGKWSKKRSSDQFKIKPSKHWHFMNDLLREYPLKARDKFIIECHIEGDTFRTINRKLKAEGFEPYKNHRYIEDRVASIEYAYLMASRKHGKLAKRLRELEFMEQVSEFRINEIIALVKRTHALHTGKLIRLTDAQVASIRIMVLARKLNNTEIVQKMLKDLA